MKRLLNVIYHPRNQYLLHLDRQARDAERVKFALYAKPDRVFRVIDNVNAMGKTDDVTYMGFTAIYIYLLRINTDWDWFITLSALGYPYFLLLTLESIMLC